MPGFNEELPEIQGPVGRWPERATVKFDDVLLTYSGGAEIRQRIDSVAARLGVASISIIRDAVGPTIDITPLIESHLAELEQPPESNSSTI